MTFEVGRLVAALAVEGVLQRHRDVGALGHRVRVVRLDVVDGDHHLNTRHTALQRAVDAMHVGVRAPDHHHPTPHVEPREHAAVPLVAELHARFAVLGELEDPHEVLERGALVPVCETRVDVGERAGGVHLGVADRGHESLLLSGQHRRVAGVVRQHPVGSELPQRLEVAHGPILPDLAGCCPLEASGSRRTRRRRRARLRRERTVPTGTSSAAAISS